MTCNYVIAINEIKNMFSEICWIALRQTQKLEHLESQDKVVSSNKRGVRGVFNISTFQNVQSWIFTLTDHSSVFLIHHC